MSRKISNSAADAFYSGRPFKSSNTEVKANADTTELYLFGNLIAIKKQKEVSITNAGWFSATTKERLNALNVASIGQKAGKWYLNGKEWDGQLTIVAK